MKHFLLLVSTLIISYSSAQVVSTVSGSGVAGVLNGVGTAARHNFPGAVVIDSLGNLYVSDYLGNVIRKITPANVVTTFAGSGVGGSANGTGTAASFYFPWGMVIDLDGNILLADQGNHKIRKITLAGVVTTVAGSGAQGSANGAALSASFYKPTDVAIDPAGNIYIADQWNHMVRKLSTTGIVSTIAGSGSAGLIDGLGAAARFNRPSGIALDKLGNIFIGDNLNNCIRKITPAGLVSTFAGTSTAGYVNGLGTAARFNGPHGIIIDTVGNMYVGESWNPVIRKVTSSGLVSTYAGSGVSGYLDGPLLTAKFVSIGDLIADNQGVIYAADCRDNRVRKLSNIYVILGNDTSICKGAPVKINLTTNASSVLWNTGDTGRSITVSPTVTTMYIATGTLNGFSLRDTMNVIIKPSPTINVGSDTFVCKGSSISLKATTNATSLVWSTGATSNSISVAPNNTTSYFATGTLNGCVNSDTVIVTVYNPPIVNPISDKFLCISDSVNLNSSNGNTYVWSPNYNISSLTSSSPKVWPKVNSTYIVSIIDSHNCISKDTILVNVDSCLKIKVRFNLLDTNICVGAILKLVNASFVKSNAILNWNFGPNAIPSTSNAYNPPNVQYNQIGDYIISLIATDSTGTDSFKMAVHVGSIQANAGKDTMLCNDALLYQIGASPLSKCIYSWTPTIGLSNANISNPVANTTASRQYVVQVADSVFKCIVFDTVNLTLYPKPNLSIQGDTAFCDAQFIQLNASSNYPVQWNNGSLSNTISVNKKAFYTVKTDSKLCEDIADSIFVNQYFTPYLYFDSIILDKKGAIRNVAVNTNGQVIKWTPLDDLKCADCKNQEITITSSRKYYITSSTGLCSVTNPLDIQVEEEPCEDISIPAIFTPNMDGLNDFYRIKHLCAFNYFEFKIYNRWGEMIFESMNPDFLWDGTYRGTPQTSGAYIYSLTYRFGGAFNKTRMGNINLIR